MVYYLVTNSTKTMHYSIHFYTNAHVLVPFMMFYDEKPQLIKTPVEIEQTKHNITKSHMPMFITNTKLQYRSKSFFHFKKWLGTKELKF